MIIKARVLGRESVLVSGIGSVVQDYLSAALAEDLDRPIVIVTANELSARQAMENMAFYAPKKSFFFQQRILCFIVLTCGVAPSKNSEFARFAEFRMDQPVCLSYRWKRCLTDWCPMSVLWNFFCIRK